MLITPVEVRNYTSFQTVKERGDFQLDYDIMQAEKDVFKYVGHKFDDTEKYPTTPEEVKLAIIKLTEYYALFNSDESLVKGYSSEKLGEYSYQIGDGESKKISLDNLLSEYVIESGGNGSTFKMRSF